MSDLPDGGSAADTDTEAQAALRAALQPGDILFYRTAAASTFFDLSPTAFKDDFPMLAAFAQGLPYVLHADGNMWSPHPDHFKPWHHVAMCVEAAGGGPARAVGFLQDNYDAQGSTDGNVVTASTSTLTNYAVEAVAGQQLSVLRGSIDMAPAVATTKALEAGSTDYSILGLLAFALATKARVFPPGQMRDDTLLMAYGAHRRARLMDAGAPEPESCVTAVGKALETVLGGRFALPEPAPPDPAETAKLFAYQLSPLTEALALLLERVENAGGSIAYAIIDDLNTVDLRRALPRFAPQTLSLADDAYPGRAVLESFMVERQRIMQATVGIGIVPGDFIMGDPVFGGPNIPEPPPLPPPGDSPYSPGPGLSTSAFIPKLEGVAEILTNDEDDDKSLVDLGIEEFAENQPVPSSEHLVASPAMLWDALTTSHGFLEVDVAQPS